jgi:hypothetical protein
VRLNKVMSLFFAVNFNPFNRAALWLPGLLVLLAGSIPVAARDPNGFSQFIGVTHFENFSPSTNRNGDAVWLSPPFKTETPWNELVVSWDADAPAGTWLKLEASATLPDHATQFYVMGLWTRDNEPFPRASVSGQQDRDGDVKVDTLTLFQSATAAQVRLTLGGTNGALPVIKFLGLAFCNTNVTPAVLPPNRAAWGKIIPTPERSQQSYPGGSGWCSPTSLSMALARWAAVAQRPDWNLDAPETAAGVYDAHFYHHTGNWPFNTAFAGSLKGMRAYVTRFSDISELEDWIAAGIPVLISARYDLLLDGRPPDLSGHLTVCRGFTGTGDLVINDPWTDLKVESVRHVYKRSSVMRAWATSHNTVYLVYPANWPVPPDRFGHWQE